MIKSSWFYSHVLATLIFITGSKLDACGASYELPSGSGAPSTVIWSPNGSYLATASTNKVTMFTVTGSELSLGTSYSLPSNILGAPGSIAFSPNGSYLAAVSENDIVMFTVETEGTLNANNYPLPSGFTNPGQLPPQQPLREQQLLPVQARLPLTAPQLPLV